MNVTLRRSIAAAVVLVVPLLSSCGFDRPTDRVYNPGVGVNNRSGSVDVLGAVIVSTSDGEGSVSATFVNNDVNHSDAVTRVTGSGKNSGVSVDLTKPLDITPGGSARLSAKTATTAKGAAIKPGAFVQLTFDFERSESVTVQVPVVPRSGDYVDVPTAAPRRSATGSPSPTTPGTKSPSTSPSESPTSSPTG